MLQARKPIVWSAASAEGTATESEAPIAAAAEDAAAAEPPTTDAAETDLPAEASEEEKRKARAKKFGIADATGPAKVTRGAADASIFIQQNVVIYGITNRHSRLTALCNQLPKFCLLDADALVIFDLHRSL